MSENKQNKSKSTAPDWSDEEKAAMQERAKELKAERQTETGQVMSKL